jgi:hypothetical protein
VYLRLSCDSYNKVLLFVPFTDLSVVEKEFLLCEVWSFIYNLDQTISRKKAKIMQYHENENFGNSWHSEAQYTKYNKNKSPHCNNFSQLGLKFSLKCKINLHVAVHYRIYLSRVNIEGVFTRCCGTRLHDFFMWLPWLKRKANGPPHSTAILLFLAHIKSP